MHNENTSYGLYFLGLCIAIGLIFSSFLGAQAIRDMRQQTISVKGVAERNVTSDRASWDVMVQTQSKTLPEGYAKIQSDVEKVRAYLIANQIDEKSIELLPIYKSNLMQFTAQGRETSVIDAYRLNQGIRVESSDVPQIQKLQQQINSLLAEGIDITSHPSQYYYSDLESLKVEMLSEATKNAMQRAAEMANNTGNKIGGIRSARQGVFQITNPSSNDVSDYGYNDSTSVQKRVRAIVSIDFSVKN